MFKGHRDSVNTLSLGVGHLLASGSDDSTCRIWDTRTTSRCVKCLSKAFDTAPVNTVSFSPTSENIIYVGASNKIYTFDLRNESIVLTSATDVYSFNTEEINQIAIHKKKTDYLAAADDSGEIKIIDLSQKRLFKSLLGGHTNICHCLAFRDKVNWDIVSGALDSSLTFWDFSRGKSKRRIVFDQHSDDFNTSTRVVNPPFVYSTSCSANGRIVAAGLGDATIAIIQYSNCQVVRRLQAHRAVVSQVFFPNFSPDSTLISVGNDDKVIVWQVDQDETDFQVKKEISHRNSMNCVVATNNGSGMYIADISKDIHYLNL